jgi:phosphohistidine phosphatase
MRILTLVRHAKSSRDYPELSDFERPLTPRGRKDAAAIATKLRKADLIPDLLVTSPALRAISTAHVFAEILGIKQEHIAVNPHIYEAAVQTLLHITRTLPDTEHGVMLFGHNPGITHFAHQLAECEFDEMPTSATVRIELAVKAWSLVRHGAGKVVRFDAPNKD